jgi:capsular exopolysaccharide synthesis family protein
MVMVTSAVRGEGKTLTIVNLALTLSDAFEQRVLLVDADLRRPKVHRLFQLPNRPGLGDVLTSDDSDVPLIGVSARLSVLSSGRPVQPMALTSHRMRDVLDRGMSMFDWVLVDTPPVGLIPDAEVLARTVGAVLFVIAANSTPHPLVQRALALLEPDSLVGTVLNQVEPEDIGSPGYYADAPSAPIDVPGQRD